MAVKSNSLCESHSGGFELFRVLSPKLLYRGTPVAKLKVRLVGKEDCAQCKANKRARERRGR